MNEAAISLGLPFLTKCSRLNLDPSRCPEEKVLIFGLHRGFNVPSNFNIVILFFILFFIQEICFCPYFLFTKKTRQQILPFTIK